MDTPQASCGESTISEWVYPNDLPVREYQLSISRQCLLRNTLVCLPTGLGKTFIAAVVILNFFRWFTTGKVLFMAPTRPLVMQQLAACLRITGLPASQITELVGGRTGPSQRQRLWETRRVFFLTPQVMVNDLQTRICPARSICCIVFDEAHRATGNHSYCQVLRTLTGEPFNHRDFRVLALSATPASDLRGLQVIIANLLISHIEMRTEDSADVQQYTQSRKLETIIVPLNQELVEVRDMLCEFAMIPLTRLCHQKALWLNNSSSIQPERMSKFRILKAREAWKSLHANDAFPPSNSVLVQRDFILSITILHAIELVLQHGLRPLYHFISGIMENRRSGAGNGFYAEMRNLSAFKTLWQRLAGRFSTPVGGNDEYGTDGALLQSQAPFSAGHPKFEKLRELLLNHFSQNQCQNIGGDAMNSNSIECDTRVIVFTQYRDSVDEIMHMLKQFRPVIRPASFIGQSSSLVVTNRETEPVSDNASPVIATGSDVGNSVSNLAASRSAVGRMRVGKSQKDQLRVMAAFRAGVFNTLVSTCVGEEGIDVGQVDLIVCFDACKSPIRLVQRLGRTGRQRKGRIVVLLTEGREEASHATGLARVSGLFDGLLASGARGGGLRSLAFYPDNVRLVPSGLNRMPRFVGLAGNEGIVDGNSPGKDLSSLASDRSCSRGRVSSLKLVLPPEDDSDAVRSHADAMGLNRFSLRLLETQPERLITALVSKATDGAANVELRSEGQGYYKEQSVGDEETLTRRYPGVLSQRALAATRQRCVPLSAAVIRSGPSNGEAATSSLHLTAALRLVELHRRSATQLIFHAMGSCSVDVESPLAILIGDHASQLSPSQFQSQLSPLPMKFSSPTLISSPPLSSPVNKSPQHPAQVPSKKATFSPARLCLEALPPLHVGLLSGQPMFSANLPVVAPMSTELQTLHLRLTATDDDAASAVDLSDLPVAMASLLAFIDSSTAVARQRNWDTHSGLRVDSALINPPTVFDGSASSEPRDQFSHESTNWESRHQPSWPTTREPQKRVVNRLMNRRLLKELSDLPTVPESREQLSDRPTSREPCQSSSDSSPNHESGEQFFDWLASRETEQQMFVLATASQCVKDTAATCIDKTTKAVRCKSLCAAMSERPNGVDSAATAAFISGQSSPIQLSNWSDEEAFASDAGRLNLSNPEFVADTEPTVCVHSTDSPSEATLAPPAEYPNLVAGKQLANTDSTSGYLQTLNLPKKAADGQAWFENAGDKPNCSTPMPRQVHLPTPVPTSIAQAQSTLGVFKCGSGMTVVRPPVPSDFCAPARSTPTKNERHSALSQTSSVQLGYSAALMLLENSSLQLQFDDLMEASPMKSSHAPLPGPPAMESGLATGQKNVSESLDFGDRLELKVCFDDSPPFDEGAVDPAADDNCLQLGFDFSSDLVEPGFTGSGAGDQPYIDWSVGDSAPAKYVDGTPLLNSRAEPGQAKFMSGDVSVKRGVAACPVENEGRSSSVDQFCHIGPNRSTVIGRAVRETTVGLAVRPGDAYAIPASVAVNEHIPPSPTLSCPPSPLVCHLATDNCAVEVLPNEALDLSADWELLPPCGIIYKSPGMLSPTATSAGCNELLSPKSMVAADASEPSPVLHLRSKHRQQPRHNMLQTQLFGVDKHSQWANATASGESLVLPAPRAKRPRGHAFLMSQADRTSGGDQDGYEDEEGPSMDNAYEESFIDDGSETTELSDSDQQTEERVGRHLNTSNMMAVYLQSIRSPVGRRFSATEQPSHQRR